MDSQLATPLPNDPDSRRRGHALQIGRRSKSLFFHISNPNPTPSILLGPRPGLPAPLRDGFALVQGIYQCRGLIEDT